MRRSLTSAALVFAVAAAASVAACQGCQSSTTTPPASADAADQKPTLRLYLVSTLAGAMEPCGCTKDQLGGVDHLAAYIAGQKTEAPHSLVLGAGPLFFMDPKLEPDAVTQDGWKAEALAQAAKDIGLTAWAPGANDWAGGAEALGRYQEMSGAALLAGNVAGAAGAAAGAGNAGNAGVAGTLVREVGGVKVGVVGVSDPKDRGGAYPAGVTTSPSLAAMKAGVEAVKRQGAVILVGLAALPRGEALRLVDEIPELHVLLLGKPVEGGETNDAPKPPMLIGTTLVAESANHLQSVGVVDLFVREAAGQAREGQKITFADAGGVAKAEELMLLSGRIRELENRINSWEADKSASPKDIAARKADLARLRAEKEKVEGEQKAVQGSFFRYSSVEVREKYGSEKSVADLMLGYYKRVNVHNKEAFKDRLPEPAAKGQAEYIGIEACTSCHDEERKVWDKTAHARAYATLEHDFKEFNLDCVSCHVTGYGKPAGSTVTHNEKLKNVQCEECHGPGSLHAKSPGKADLIVLSPKPESCVSQCHHPPHVEGFDAVAKMRLVLGPGHGME
ncbi:cytochrome c family protein [Chondromyces apiculatus]|uniref:Cytochrome c family protein n=1 Tax=Chondromyces apiculatus DSM 436 TaxID=1192034 RepID=A0A017TCR2_9BACT|nr:cytochrome c family protein [Chondromyces apiculatus]EYF06426.1 Cytochrome c family protein [Chondromyces apiculatus DSM 436]